MTRRCRIACANLRGDGAIVCPKCWERLPSWLRADVARSPKNTMMMRLAAQACYDWLNKQQNPETVLCPLTASAIELLEVRT